jgi:hypothetical protein
MKYIILCHLRRSGSNIVFNYIRSNPRVSIYPRSELHKIFYINNKINLIDKFKLKYYNYKISDKLFFNPQYFHKKQIKEEEEKYLIKIFKILNKYKINRKINKKNNKTNREYIFIRLTEGLSNNVGVFKKILKNCSVIYLKRNSSALINTNLRRAKNIKIIQQRIKLFNQIIKKDRKKKLIINYENLTKNFIKTSNQINNYLGFDKNEMHKIYFTNKSYQGKKRYIHKKSNKPIVDNINNYKKYIIKNINYNLKKI